MIDIRENEKRLLALLRGPAGKFKIAKTLENILYDKVPPFIMNIKGKKEMYHEVIAASQVIVEEEVAKGEDDLYNRIKNRIDSYWEDSMSQNETAVELCCMVNGTAKCCMCKKPVCSNHSQEFEERVPCRCNRNCGGTEMVPYCLPCVAMHQPTNYNSED